MKGKSKFLRAYLIYVAVLTVLVAACIVYVNGLLKEYEALRPERQVESAVAQLKVQAAQPQAFWEKYAMPTVDGGAYEQNMDIQSAYLQLYASDKIEFAQKTGAHAEDELLYVVRHGNFPLAEVKLKAKGPQTTKLLVFSTREWAVSEIKPLLEKRTYTLSLPRRFTVKIADTPLVGEEKDGKQLFTVAGVYLQPSFVIEDENGTAADYTVKNFRVLPNIYDYSLTLPAELTVMVNGVKSEGTEAANGQRCHTVASIEKPQMTVADTYGNTVTYEGGVLPLTYMTVLAPPEYTVTVEGKKVAATPSVLEEYTFLEGLTDGLPSTAKTTVAVLKEQAAVQVTDASGKPIALKDGETMQDLTAPLPKLDTVPQEIADKIDVVKAAQNWSLFMSNDLTFAQLEPLLLPDSYQYTVAKQYATGTDRLFFSKHTLANPAFTDVAVKNFTRITEDCFSVDVHFVKHMRLPSGKAVNDPMNDRFYFVHRDGKWLLAGLKEVTADV